ncbi:MAG: rod shape-determining protein MreC [Planctomycetota bacterium]|jgi:rod shape-determining protein MreC
MSSRDTKISGGILFMWLTLVAFVFFFAPSRWTDKFQLAFAAALRRPLSTARNLSLSARGGNSQANWVSRTKYNMLQNHLANTVAWLHEERQKVERLSGLRNRSAWQGAKFVLADVITCSISDSQARLIINRGQDDGLAIDQYVISEYGIIGTISSIDSGIAGVTLVTDPASKIPVKIDQDSQAAPEDTALIMRGCGRNTATIRLLPTKRQIKVGSVVHARKKPGLLSTPIIVGTVVRRSRDAENPLLWDITVQPACDIEELTTVAVIVMNQRE